MANGFDSVSNSIQVGSDRHIHVFQQIKLKVDSGEFKILINEIILNEWARNKNTAYAHIKELGKQKKMQSLIGSIEGEN